MNDATVRVLTALHRAGDRPCSGADLSSDLGVSRAQIWKHVGVLRQRGYEIEGTPGGGYRLTAVPDRLFAEEVQRGLDTRWLGRRIEYHDEIDSTNRVAVARALGGAEHGTAIIAESQTAGRGRLGRAFYSPPHQNLYTSIVLRPELDTAATPTLLLAAGVAVADAVVLTLGGREGVEIKWPNDVLIDGLKTSGVLMELGTEEARVRYAVLGIGVNLNVDPARFPDEFRSRATSLSARLGGPVDRVAFCRRLYRALEEIIDLHRAGGLAAIRPRFDAYFRMVGRRVLLHPVTGPDLGGVVRGIGPTGALLLESDDGRTHEVLAGDVTLSPRPPAQEGIRS